MLEYINGNDLDFLLKQQKTLPEKEVSYFLLKTFLLFVSSFFVYGYESIHASLPPSSSSSS